MGDSSRPDEIRYDLARNRARGIITLTKQRPPIDVQAIIDLAGIPVVERALQGETRATIGDVAGAPEGRPGRRGRAGLLRNVAYRSIVELGATRANGAQCLPWSHKATPSATMPLSGQQTICQSNGTPVEL